MQRNFTKYFPGLYNLSYTEILQLLTLNTLDLRHLENDPVFLHEIFYNLVGVNCDKHLSDNVMRNRGYNLNMNVQGSRINCRKYFFINRVVPIWNGFDESVVNSEGVWSFMIWAVFVGGAATQSFNSFACRRVVYYSKLAIYMFRFCVLK